jgi:hypothetical protein
VRVLHPLLSVAVTAALSHMRVDVRPSDLCNLRADAAAKSAFIADRMEHPELYKLAPEWIRARVMAGLPATLLPPVPVAVLDPSFGDLVDFVECGDVTQMDGDFISRVADLMIASADFYAGERARNQMLLAQLRTILDVAIVKTESDSASYPSITDGSGFGLTAAGSDVLLVNVELKDSIKSGRPELQNVAYYLQHYCPRPSDTRSAGIPSDLPEDLHLVPALLLDIHGGVSLSVRGAVLTGFAVMTDVLATAHLIGRPASAQHLALARVLFGVKCALNDLAQRYRSARSSTTAARAARAPFPVAQQVGALLPTRFSTGSSTLTVHAGAPLLADRLAFEATLDTSTGPAPCVLKLAHKQYGEDAHRTAARLHLAPELLGVSRLPGGWFAVIMEKLDCRDGWEPYNRKDDSQRSAVRAAWERGIRDQGNVHGDLRTSNILVRRQSYSASLSSSSSSSSSTASAPHAWQVAFIDWDWAGKEGAAKYPMTRNPHCVWAPESIAGGDICVIHDDYMLNIP